MNFFNDCFYSGEERFDRAKDKEWTRPLKAHEFRMDKVKPPTYYYSYSEPASQGALICETSDFPIVFNRNTVEIHSAYSDRMQGWDSKHYQELCNMIGAGEQSWHIMKGFGDQKLREIAKFAFKLDVLPLHVRIIHYYNVATGYSCPVIVAVCRKQKAKEDPPAKPT